MEQNVEEAKKKGSKEKREGNLAAQEGAYKKGCKEKREGNLAPQEGANDQEQPSSDPLRVSD